MRQLNADMYICPIDGDAVHTRLNNEHETQPHAQGHIGLARGRIIGTEMLCKGINDKIPFYCLTREREQGPLKVLPACLRAQRKKSISEFPMTAVVEMENVKQKIDDFRSTMKKLSPASPRRPRGIAPSALCEKAAEPETCFCRGKLPRGR